MICFKSVTYLLIVLCYFYGLCCNNVFVQGQTQWGKVRVALILFEKWSQKVSPYKNDKVNER